MNYNKSKNLELTKKKTFYSFYKQIICTEKFNYIYYYFLTENKLYFESIFIKYNNSNYSFPAKGNNDL